MRCRPLHLLILVAIAIASAPWTVERLRTIATHSRSHAAVGVVAPSGSSLGRAKSHFSGGAPFDLAPVPAVLTPPVGLAAEILPRAHAVALEIDPSGPLAPRPPPRV